jgi:ribulose-bisphosphate carboxylase large chain
VGREADFEEVAGGIAAESSVGTWTRVETEIKEVFDRLHARVLETEKITGFLKIAYPLDLFEAGNIPQLLSSVAGNIFGLKEIRNLKLLDLILPGKYVQSFAGPALGIDGIRKLTGVFDRPLIGCIIKPKLGLDFKAHARVAYEVFEGGVDFVKDDENLTSQDFNPFEKRVKEICSNVLKQWNKKIYAFNVTGPIEVMGERAKLVKSKNGNCIMIDFLTAGFAALQSLGNINLGLIIHGHRAMHAAFTRGDQGISMLVLAKLARLAGVDSLHTGTVVGKMEGEKEEVRKINQFLLSEWYGIKPVLPVASGGLHPGLVPNLVKILGKNVLLNFGGGIHGHPNGPRAGAMAVKAAVEATQRGISLLEYGKINEDLAIALEHWAAERPEGEE